MMAWVVENVFSIAGLLVIGGLLVFAGFLLGRVWR